MNNLNYWFTQFSNTCNKGTFLIFHIWFSHSIFFLLFESQHMVVLCWEISVTPVITIAHHIIFSEFTWALIYCTLINIRMKKHYHLQLIKCKRKSLSWIMIQIERLRVVSRYCSRNYIWKNDTTKFHHLPWRWVDFAH